MRKFTLLTLLALAVSVSCNGEDTDTDTDADTDTDSDTDTDPLDTFSGTATYTMTYDGTTWCDTAVSLDGIEYTGPCDNCTFGFEIVSTVTTDNSTVDCANPTPWTLTWVSPPDNYYPMLMIHSTEWYSSYYSSTFYNTFMSGVYFTGYSYPYMIYLIHDGTDAGTFTRTGDDISWTWGSSSSDMDFVLDCDGTPLPATIFMDSSLTTSTDLAVGGTDQTEEDVPCSARDKVDVWQFTGDGTTVSFTADTMTTGFTFDPYIYVNYMDADGSGSADDFCTVVAGDDGFDCTVAPPAWGCPTVSVDTVDTVVYQLVVGSWGSCDDTTTDLGKYNLRVSASAPAVTLLTDDRVLPLQVNSASGTGTITPAR
jgi:hypothetical protein